MIELDYRQLAGLGYERAELFGKPHLNAHYKRRVDYLLPDRAVRSDHRIDDGATCPFCGGGPATDAHHMAQKGMGGGSLVFTLPTEWGIFILLSPLFALCRRHHDWFHQGHLSIRWEWDSDEDAERWWSGYLLSHGYAPHDPRLFGLGRYIVTAKATGKEVEFRG